MKIERSTIAAGGKPGSDPYFPRPSSHSTASPFELQQNDATNQTTFN